jgi:phasin family protein
VADKTETTVTKAKADVLPVVEAVKAPVAPVAKAGPVPAEAAKVEAVKAEPVKAEPVKAEPVKAAPAKIEAAVAAPIAKAPETKKPVRRAAKTLKARKPTKKAAPRIAKAKPAKPVVQPTRPASAAWIVKEETITMTTQTNKAAETAQFAAEQFKTVFGDVNERAKGAMEKTAKVAEELADLTRGNVEAFVASSKVAAKGVEAISQNAAEYSRKSFEDASTALKSFAEVKSATDFFKLQGDFARSAFDAAVAESARVSETVLKLAGEVAEPLTSRYSVAAERVKTLAA